MEATVTSNNHPQRQDVTTGESAIINDASVHKEAELNASGNSNTSEDDKRFLVLDLRVHLNDTYEAFAKDIIDDQARRRRFKKVGLWSLQLAAQAFFMGLAGNLA
ncbi:hypothetical protein P7C71_g5945, partial [Lecanoromycetidae sp. Uapishka_2]